MLKTIFLALCILAQPPAANAVPSAAERLTRLGMALGDGSARQRDFFVRALQADPAHAPALCELAAWNRRNGRKDAALLAYLRAVQVDPAYGPARFALAEFLRWEDVDPAPAEGPAPRLEIMPAIRRLELARLYFQAFLESDGGQPDGRLASLARLNIAEIEGELAALNHTAPIRGISWEEAARRLVRPADPARSPYEGPRLALGVEFERGSSNVSYGSSYLLDAIARALETEGLRRARILVEGHADSTGDRAANRRLSAQRAQSVRDYLVSRGIERGRLEIAGMGEAHPLVPNYSEENRQINRRVEIVNLDAIERIRGVSAPAAPWVDTRAAAALPGAETRPPAAEAKMPLPPWAEEIGASAEPSSPTQSRLPDPPWAQSGF